MDVGIHSMWLPVVDSDGDCGMDVVEHFARRIAATKMCLVNDPRGTGLPTELWKQYEGKAIDLIAYVGVIIDLLHQPKHRDGIMKGFDADG